MLGGCALSAGPKEGTAAGVNSWVRKGLRAQGLVPCGLGQGRISPYAHEGVGIGPLRIWLADEDVPGLSMTRAFGDSVAARVGLRPKPEIRQILLTPEDRYLLLMSDGITEFTDEQELLNLVHQRVSLATLPPLMEIPPPLL